MGHKDYAPDTRPLLIAGRTPYVEELALRRILRSRSRSEPLLVMDCQGNLTSALTKRIAGSLANGPLIWCDIANRNRPVKLFQFRKTAGMRVALETFLTRLARLRPATISTAAIAAAVDIAERLCDQGSVGLVALARMLHRPELAFSWRRNPELGAQLDRLHDLLHWCLGFPTIWALSEANNPVDIHKMLAHGAVVWLEIQASHLERMEHRIVCWMLDAMALDAMTSLAQFPGEPQTQAASVPIILHGHPQDVPLAMRVDGPPGRHVAVCTLTGDRPLPTAAAAWLERKADVWITGPVGDLSKTGRLAKIAEEDVSRIQSMQIGHVWVRSGMSGKSMVARLRAPEESPPWPTILRARATKSMQVSPVHQFSSAARPESNEVRQRGADLYQQLCTKTALFAGWLRIKTQNRQSRGFDRVTLEQFGNRVDQELTQLADELERQTYRSRPLRTVRIPKDDGDYRTLRIAAVRDRVVQAACLQLIEPLFDRGFSAASFAYRHGRSAHHAVAMARAAISSGKSWAVTADIRKCFDTIDHDILLRLMADAIQDHDLLHLIRHWLTTEVVDFADILPSELGVPQGVAISPLLANIYLDPMDKEFERANTSFVRYADDYLILCATEAEAQAALLRMSEFLQGSLRLSLKPAKTNYGNVRDGVRFLGFSIGLGDVRILADRQTRILQALCDCAGQFADPQIPMEKRVRAFSRLNAMIRGVRDYFAIDSAPGIVEQLAQMDNALDVSVDASLSTDMQVGPMWASRERLATVLLKNAHSTDKIPFDASGGYSTARSRGPEFIYPQGNPSIGAVEKLSPQSSDVPGGQPPDAVDPEVMQIAGRLHVMRGGCYTTIHGSDLLVRRRKNELHRTRIADLSMVYLEGRGIAVSADLAMELSQHDIPVVLAPLIGAPAAVVQAVRSSRANVRQQQVLRRNDPDIMRAGLDMLAAKVANQASVLKYFARYRKKTDDDLYGAMTRAANELREFSQQLEAIDPVAATARNIWMGHEGRAAARYWSTLTMLIPKEMAFPGRHTRHATDPVNSAINYVYGMLYGEVWRAVTCNGLDPYFGIVHGSERDQGSLIFDLIEEYRAPFGDRVVLGMLGRGFEINLDKDGLLRVGCRRKLVAAFHKSWARPTRWHGKQMTPAAILETQIASMKSAYLGKGEYQAFRFRW